MIFDPPSFHSFIVCVVSHQITSPCTRHFARADILFYEKPPQPTLNPTLPFVSIPHLQSRCFPSTANSRGKTQCKPLTRQRCVECCSGEPWSRSCGIQCGPDVFFDKDLTLLSRPFRSRRLPQAQAQPSSWRARRQPASSAVARGISLPCEVSFSS